MFIYTILLFIFEIQYRHSRVQTMYYSGLQSFISMTDVIQILRFVEYGITNNHLQKQVKIIK